MEHQHSSETISEALLDIFVYMNDAEHTSYEEANRKEKKTHIYNSVRVLGDHLGFDMTLF